MLLTSGKMGFRKCYVLLLPASVELFDRTELIEQLLVDQPRCEEEFVV